jgi:hypothetical protein
VSVKLMTGVFNLPLPPVEKLVLLCLADHASDDGGQCFPSVGRVVLKSGLTRRGVQKVYRRLEVKGILVPIGQRKEGMTEYRIVIEGGEHGSQGERTRFAGRGEHSSREGANLSARGGERGSHESSLTVIKPKTLSAVKPQTDGFDEFWELYPRKVAKQEALKAWRTVKADELPAILNGLSAATQADQWRKDGGKFVPHPATWLRGRRWEDEATIPSQAPVPGSRPIRRSELNDADKAKYAQYGVTLS